MSSKLFTDSDENNESVINNSQIISNKNPFRYLSQIGNIKFNIFIFVIYFFAFGSFSSDVFKNILHIPSIVTILREIFIYLLFFLVLNKLFYKIHYYFLIFGFVSFSMFYIFVSAFEGKIIEGLYYYRLYVIPIIFAITCINILSNITFKQAKRLINHILIINLITCILGFLIYFYYFYNPNFFFLLKGIPVGGNRESNLANAWFLSGGNILRMGEPQIAPNELGLEMALFIFIYFILIKKYNIFFKNDLFLYFMMFIDIIILLLTFSRSAILSLFIAFSLLLLIHWKKYLSTIVKYSIVGLIVLTSGAVVVNEVTKGKLAIWLDLNINLKDTSIQGHQATIDDAFRNFDEYALVGYEKGSVGPRASIFNKQGKIKNVESSFLVLIYDMGIFCFFIFIYVYFVLIIIMLNNSHQLCYMMIPITQMFFLPSIYDLEILALSSVLIVLTGEINKINNKLKLNKSMS